jgi:hypothetical protein
LCVRLFDKAEIPKTGESLNKTRRELDLLEGLLEEEKQEFVDFVK